MLPWRQKAHVIIAKLNLDAWHKANHDKNGKRYKRHRPYTPPEDAQTLVDCLNKNDEERAKALFIRLAYN